jgi:hypothetical protein
MPLAQPSGNPGQAANAVAQIREALQLLQHALPNVPVGSELHDAVLSTITKLTKVAPASEASPGIQKTAAIANAQQTQQEQPMASLMRALGGPGANPSGEQPMM